MIELPLSTFVRPRKLNNCIEIAPFCGLAAFHFAHQLAIEPYVDALTYPVRSLHLQKRAELATVILKLDDYGFESALVCTGPYSGTLALPPTINQTWKTTAKSHNIPFYTPLLRSFLVIRPLMTQLVSYNQLEFLTSRITESIKNREEPKKIEWLHNVLEKLRLPLEREPEYNIVEYILRLLKLHNIEVDEEQFWQNNTKYWEDLAPELERYNRAHSKG